jgi:periplasmic protein CpxP/Spy
MCSSAHEVHAHSGQMLTQRVSGQARSRTAHALAQGDTYEWRSYQQAAKPRLRNFTAASCAFITNAPQYALSKLFFERHIMHNPVNSRRWFTSLAALGGLAAMATSAHAQTTPPDGRGPGGPSAEDMAKMLNRRIDHLIKEIDGTPDQKDRLTKLAQSAMTDMKPLREQHMAARKKAMELLSAQSVDRSALEQLRAQQIQLADTMSKRMVQHMADAADVLTPAQRAKLAARMKERGERGGHRGHHGGGHDGGAMGGLFGGWGR